jgi:hypothetical protein
MAARASLLEMPAFWTIKYLREEVSVFMAGEGVSAGCPAA